MEPLMGSIQLFAGNFAPNGWFFCDGKLLPINQYSALFSILMNTYGGDGVQTFALPDLRGRAPVHQGTAASGTYYALGALGGAENLKLTEGQLPPHSHNVNINSEAPNVGLGTNAYLGFNANADTGEAINFYSDKATAGSTLNAGVIAASGGGQSVYVMSPYLALNYIIAWQGIYPSRP